MIFIKIDKNQENMRKLFNQVIMLHNFDNNNKNE